jgi:two-component system response regulator
MRDVDGVEVLLVESDDGAAEATANALRDAKFAHKLYRVGDGGDALDFVNCAGVFAGRNPRDLPRLILLARKPGASGSLDILRALKGNARTHALPVVVMSPHDERDDMDACYQAGVNGYVVTPPVRDEMEKAIATMGTFWLTINRVPACWRPA